MLCMNRDGSAAAVAQTVRRLLVVLSLLVISIPTVIAALPADAAGPLAFAAALAAGLVVVVAASGTELRLNPEARPAWARTLSLRDCAEQTVFLRLRDPDARGRTRPRAPSAALAAA